ncbi:2-amino-4-hydroxy-6-hydroxymethyldihydropteridine diphosphokinase [Chitinophaga dinghuensis]|uniref:2-amino-4-hydroxy-6-hydroxymethyldihydropteridine pyrophosphokinase n=1 Tax=Chitinophaga dinghuensis TaxID=1539050 RepID=A0A327VZC2_9BACT|nr:2-amino-4-hydroxy-6-hydroxymethyldihydropteridine diphosphokinase [Chitinophaga dinghuensis]RAJ81832.1 2-amino-4-hydroxy-6-hydroxymethyldihydropteridine diphosphokinase [Chitinophaga dinghuensis]
MNTAILLIGGNLGDPRLSLEKAVQLIGEKAGQVTKKSALYQTAPWGVTDQPDYLNQGLEVQTELDAPALLQCLLEIERNIGRVRQEKWGSRVIDIDMIFFNADVISLPELKIPHPRMQLRNFVLKPLEEIIPGFIHPVLQQTISQLLAVSPDKLPAYKL